MIIALAILTVHFLADFVFQSSKMATGKSKSLKWLSIHVGVYGAVTLLSAVFISFKVLSYGDVLIWWLGNVGLHFIVDFFTSKITSRLWEQKNMRLFFVMIGFDQLLHSICLLGTYYFIESGQLIIKP
jgi:membrane-bound metal-dependent hydrolase YbcI (DUF457 family)